MDDGTTKMVTYGKVVDIWEPEVNVSRTEVEKMLAEMGATVVETTPPANSITDEDIPF